MENKTNILTVIIIVCFIGTLYFLPFLFKETNTQVSIPKNTTIKNDCEIQIQVKDSQTTLDLEEYVTGVVAAEMPVNFHPEALKAQAIAARTYVLKTTNYGQQAIEPTVLRQVFYDEDTRKERWNESFEQYESKVREAVENTAGEVILYNDELITAMFHSMSNGMTESAKNFSGSDLPYLQSVVSADFQNASNFTVTTTLSLSQWNELLKGDWTLEQIKNIKLTKNDSGRVETVTLGNNAWSGREIRERFNLRSTDFQINVEGNNILITTEGYGHGVGMSQYGADAMAKNGATAHEILKHYYQNTEIEKMKCKK